MKKHLLSVLSLISACTISATQYMHINLPDGKEYDVKVEKTDNVSHVKQGDEVFIKVTRTDNSYSLYPIKDAEVTFDNEIARVDGDVNKWNIVSSRIEGCVYDTTEAHERRLNGASELELEYLLERAKIDYDNCVSKKKDEKRETFDSSEIKTQSAANKFAAELFSEISQDNVHKDKNFIFSPTSLQFALAMLANGADNDDAYAEITTALGQENMPLDQLNGLYSKRMTNFQLVNPSEVKIGLANATFLQNGITFGKNFLQNLDEFYKATAVNVDFSKDTTYTMMDNWAKECTNGMIPSLGIAPDPQLLTVLANALSFQSEWEEKFNPAATKPGKFVTSIGVEKQVEKMNSSFEGYYAEGKNFQLATLPFHDGFEMNIILPNEGVLPEAALAEYDMENIKYKNEKTEEGVSIVYCPNLSLPKFNIDAQANLNEALEKMGLEKTFSSYFDNIAEGAFVQRIKQLAHLEIDEDGAKGAAVTVIMMAGECLKEYKYIDFDVNRPFVVTITNPRNHELLFIGLINDPTEK